MSLLVRPGCVELSLAVLEDVLMTRMVAGQGIHLVEAVTAYMHIRINGRCRSHSGTWAHEGCGPTDATTLLPIIRDRDNNLV